MNYNIVILFLVSVSSIVYINDFQILEHFYTNLYHYLGYLFSVAFGYMLNIYIGSNHWYMTNIEDMYMIELNDFYGKKVIFLQKSIKNNKTVQFNYNLNTYTLMKRVHMPLTENVKKVLDFIKED